MMSYKIQGQRETAAPFLRVDMASGRHSTSKVDWFYGTRRWKNCSRAYIKSVGGLCERCLAKGVYTPAALVHHKVPLTPYNVGNPDIALGWGNLEALCAKCHAEEHGRIGGTGKRYAVDDAGRVVPLPDGPP